MATTQDMRDSMLLAIDVGATFGSSDVGFRAHMCLAYLCGRLEKQGETELVAALDCLLDLNRPASSAAGA